MTKYKAIGNNVIIRPFTMQEKTDGGIFIPEMAKQEHLPEAGTILSIGEKLKMEFKEKLEFTEGETVYFSKHGNTVIEEDAVLSVPYQNLNAKLTT